MVGRVLEGCQRGPLNRVRTRGWAADRREFQHFDRRRPMRRVLRLVGRHVVDEVFLFAWAASSWCDVDLWRGDHTHELFWIDGDLRAGSTCRVTMQPC